MNHFFCNSAWADICPTFPIRWKELQGRGCTRAQKTPCLSTGPQEGLSVTQPHVGKTTLATITVRMNHEGSTCGQGGSPLMSLSIACADLAQDPWQDTPCSAARSTSAALDGASHTWVSSQLGHFIASWPWPNDLTFLITGDKNNTDLVYVTLNEMTCMQGLLLTYY